MVTEMQADDSERHQPQFSWGERLATLEAELQCLEKERIEGDDLAQEQLDRRLKEAERLQDEKLAGLRKELGAISQAQREAVAKAEVNTDRRLELIGAQMDSDRTTAASALDRSLNRIAALERGESRGQGAGELKASTLAWVGALAALALVILYVVHP